MDGKWCQTGSTDSTVLSNWGSEETLEAVCISTKLLGLLEGIELNISLLFQKSLWSLLSLI